MNKRRSKFEANVEKALLKLTPGVRYEHTRFPYTLESNYVADFTLDLERGLDGRPEIYVEAKGRFTGHDRRKMLAVKQRWPQADIRLCFMRNNKLYRGAKSTYLDWARKHGFPATVFPALPVTKEETK